MTDNNIDYLVRTDVPFKTKEMTETDGKMWALYTQGMAEYEKDGCKCKAYQMDRLSVTKYSPSGYIEDVAYRINDNYNAYKQIVILPKETTSTSTHIYGQLQPVVLYPETFEDILKSSSSVYFGGLNGLIVKEDKPYTYTQYMRVNIEDGRLELKPQNMLEYDVDLNKWTFKTYKESELSYDILAYGITY